MLRCSRPGTRAIVARGQGRIWEPAATQTRRTLFWGDHQTGVRSPGMMRSRISERATDTVQRAAAAAVPRACAPRSGSPHPLFQFAPSSEMVASLSRSGVHPNPTRLLCFLFQGGADRSAAPAYIASLHVRRPSLRAPSRGRRYYSLLPLQPPFRPCATTMSPPSTLPECWGHRGVSHPANIFATCRR